MSSERRPVLVSVPPIMNKPPPNRRLLLSKQRTKFLNRERVGLVTLGQWCRPDPEMPGEGRDDPRFRLAAGLVAVHEHGDEGKARAMVQQEPHLLLGDRRAHEGNGGD